MLAEINEFLLQELFVSTVTTEDENYKAHDILH